MSGVCSPPLVPCDGSEAPREVLTPTLFRTPLLQTQNSMVPHCSAVPSRTGCVFEKRAARDRRLWGYLLDALESWRRWEGVGAEAPPSLLTASFCAFLCPTPLPVPSSPLPSPVCPEAPLKSKVNQIKSKQYKAPSLKLPPL